MYEGFKAWARAFLAAPPGNDTDTVNRLLTAAILISFGIVIARFGWDVKSATAGMWGIACLASGGFVGFLFGIPRLGRLPPTDARGAGEPEQARTNWQSNSNLVEVSDWLTKIIVGLGLINLEKLPGQLRRSATAVAMGFDSTRPSDFESFSLALLVGFTLIGFLGGYLYTRIYLQGAMVRADQKDFATTLAKEMTDARGRADRTMTPADGGPPVLPSKDELQQAEKIGKLATAADQPVVLAKMQDLAREYEMVRASMPPGPERTREMNKIAAQMRPIALAASSSIDAFAASDSPGDRLAAIVMLQVKFDPKFISWLADCLINEVPFMGYHASIATYQAAKIVGEPYRSKLRAELVRAQKALAAANFRDKNRDQLISEALAELDGTNAA